MFHGVRDKQYAYLSISHRLDPREDSKSFLFYSQLVWNSALDLHNQNPQIVIAKYYEVILYLSKLRKYFNVQYE